jgi:tyrosinase
MTAHHAVRVRRDVWSLDPWDDVLVWYARAVDAMQGRSRSDPTSWQYQANIHGLEPPGPHPDFWNQCQHQTWYFLPWHRGYLQRFEEIVRSAIRHLGGPSDWALPYWNYSDASNPDAYTLPPAFRDSTAPGLGHNPLRVAQRSSRANSGQRVGPLRDTSVDALDVFRFKASPHGASGGFGGPETGFNHGGGRFGELEAVPHGVVHVDVGGLMGDPATAARDPIFWLHHANIDRLWAIWIGEGHRNPTNRGWLNLKFKLHDAHSHVVTFSAADMLDTEALGYRYDSLDDPRGPHPVAPALATEAEMDEDEPTPEMVGATEAPTELGAAPASAQVRIEAPSGPAAVAGEGAPEVFLSLENVTGATTATNYDVYVNLPQGAAPDDHEDRLAGVLSTFGIARATSPDDPHGGGGLHATFDITGLVERLRAAGDWDEAALRVTFVPREADEELPPVRVGRVSVYHRR